ncbi:hypothetical protein [Oceanirhabdus seepicola]|uniref:Uncharacterized protein n=1 Tax=Oceanirhabdus seepicola TaxID=2828781 RepID=A0A9J6P6W2_9CLOT|nr:hypothetical protein [Oceanirhabdus seepicola]MCM1992495.1 hypothetical protein [Oceanirhabdus seepicola]
MVELIYRENKKIIKIDGIEKFIYEELGYIDIREICGQFLREIEKQSFMNMRLEDIFIYENIPLYIFMRPAFSVWLSSKIELIYILKYLNDKYEDILIKTDNEELKEINNEFFNLELIMVEKENDNSKIKKKSKNVFGYFKRLCKGIGSAVSFLLCKKERMVMYSMASTIAESKKGGVYRDYLYGDLQKELESKYSIMNIQLLQSEKELYKSGKAAYKVVPLELFILYKKIFMKNPKEYNKIKRNLDVIDNIEFIFEGFDLKGMVKGFMKNRGESICKSYLKEIILFQRFFKKFGVKKCIAIDEGDRGRCLISAGNLVDINTYAIQHGIIVRNSHSYHLTTENKKVIPKTTFLWGENYKKLLSEMTDVYGENNLSVVGNIRSDELRKSIIEKKIEDKSEERIKILFLSQYMDDLVYMAGNILFDGLKRLKRDYELVIKLHPGDNKYREYYEEEIKKKNINGKIVKDKDLYEMINECHCVVSVHSTAVLEAALLKKPSICLRLPKYDDVCKFVEDGISKGARNGDELIALIMKFEEEFGKDYHDKMANYIKNAFFVGNDKSSKMISAEIEKI